MQEASPPTTKRRKTRLHLNTLPPDVWHVRLKAKGPTAAPATIWTTDQPRYTAYVSKFARSSRVSC
jgi:hypothetical protein